MNFSAAIQRIIAELIELAEGGELPAIEGLDLVPTDDGRDLIIRIHLADQSLIGGLCLSAAINLEAEYRRRIEDSIMAAAALRHALRREPICGTGRAVLPKLA